MKRFLGVLVLCAVVLCYFLSNNVEAKTTYDPAAYENSDELYLNGDITKRYYDIDGSDYTIDDYHTNLFAKNIEGLRLINEYNVLADDPIINIIPKEYFETEGDHSADGKEYYYHIKTTKEVGYLNALLGGKNGNYYKNVVMYVNYEQVCDEKRNIEGYKDLQENTFSHKLEIHQFIFYTLDLTKDGIYWPSTFAPMRNHLSVSKGITNKSVVIPKPTLRTNDYTFKESDSHFWIQDIGCAESIINTHDENQNNGLFLTSVEKEEDVTKFSLGQEPDSGLGELFFNSIINFFPFYSEVSTVISIYNYAEEIVDLFRKDDDLDGPYFITQAEIMDKSRICFWSNKLDQIRNGGLIKNYVAYLEGLSLNSNEHATFNFRYSYDTSDQYKLGAIIQTDFIYSVGFDGEILETVHHTNKMEVANGEYFDTISVNSPKEGYNYGKTYEKYEFFPSTTGVYNFKVDNNQILRLYDENYNIINLSTELIEGNNYYVEVYNSSSTSTYYNLIVESLSDVVAVSNTEVSMEGSNIKIDITFETLNRYIVYVKDIGTFNINSNGHCYILIPKSYNYNEISYFGLLNEMYVVMENGTTLDLILDDSINNYIRNQNFISQNYLDIISYISKPGLWYNVKTEIAFLAMIYMYNNNVWISYDDGINNDSYMIEDAQTEFFRLERDLDFKGYTFVVPYKVYLYGAFDGVGHTISNLKLDSSFKYFYLENYGTFVNVVFKNCEITSIFKMESGYGEYINVRIE